MIDSLLCHYQKSLIELLNVINENAKGIAFIVDDGRKLKGIMTDGDVRRCLLKQIPLHTRIVEVLSPDYSFATTTEPYEDLHRKCNDRIKIIPIVDNDHRVVDFFEYQAAIKIPVAAPNLQGNEFSYLVDAFLSSWISSSGAYIERFERDFASFCDCAYGVATSNGTTALHLALVSLGIGLGDEVIVPDLTFAATINAVIYTGAKPVIVDVEEDSWCINPLEIEKAISAKTKAVIPVHLYGQPADMSAIVALKEKYGFYLIEDCAEAHGATYHHKKVGSYSDIACFSFYGNKVVTTGEGGMCLTQSQELNEKCRVLRDHGMNKQNRYWHDEIGFNYRMTNLQAAIGVAQTERISQILAQRKGIEKAYRNALQGISFLEFQREDLPQRDKITWLVSAIVKDGKRDSVMSLLKANHIDTRPFFYPLSAMPVYALYKGNTPISHKLSASGITFPTTLNLPSDYFVTLKQLFESLQ